MLRALLWTIIESRSGRVRVAARRGAGLADPSRAERFNYRIRARGRAAGRGAGRGPGGSRLPGPGLNIKPPKLNQAV